MIKPEKEEYIYKDYSLEEKRFLTNHGLTSYSKNETNVNLTPSNTSQTLCCILLPSNIIVKFFLGFIEISSFLLFILR